MTSHRWQRRSVNFFCTALSGRAEVQGQHSRTYKTRETNQNTGMLLKSFLYDWSVGSKFIALSCFFKFTTILMGLKFIEHTLHLSHAKQMYSQTMLLTHELKLRIQIIRGESSLPALRFELWLSERGFRAWSLFSPREDSSRELSKSRQSLSHCNFSLTKLRFIQKSLWVSRNKAELTLINVKISTWL